MSSALLPTGTIEKGLWAIRDGVVNLYLLEGPDGLVAVDAGWRPRHILRAFKTLGLDPRHVAAVFLTHSHWDHVWGLTSFPKATVHGGAAGGRILQGEELVFAAGLRIQAIPCPGHTADSFAFLDSEGRLFTGDSIWLRRGEAHPGPSWFNQDTKLLCASLRRLATLTGNGSLFTAHRGMAENSSAALQRWMPQS